MNIREKFSVVLLCMGVILALLPISMDSSFKVKPQKLLSDALDQKTYLTVDQVAKFVISEDSTVQIIDLRSSQEFRYVNIPGSINIPYTEFINNDPGIFLINGNMKSILYSNGDFDSNYALVVAKGLKYKNIYVMKGGLNEWFTTIMNSSFTGERITPRENALFETRTRAREMFTAINSLPDSLKLKFIMARHVASRRLDGGCE